MSARPLLVTGANGQVGWELARALQPLGPVVALDRAALDLGDPARAAAVIRSHAPSVIVNAAAWTAVDAAEGDEAGAMRVNADGVGALGRAAAEVGALVVHYSTDYVFDGALDRPYREDDAPQPLGAYGRSKHAGEVQLAQSGAAHLVFRTSWVYAARGHNFLRTMLRLAREREVMRVVDDQVGTPTSARWLADATAQVVGALVRDPRGAAAAAAPVQGVYHLVGGGSTSWHGFARAILAGDPGRAAHRVREVAPIPTSAYPTPAARPRNSRLDAARAVRTFGLHLTPWEAQLAAVLAELPAAGGAP